jgi:hypothetical protein
VAASHALSQLSYGPVRPKCSGELKIARPVHAADLVVSARPQPQVDLGSPREQFKWKEVAAFDIRAIGREGIDLSLHVDASDQPVTVSTRSVATQDYDIAMARRPFALHTNEAGSKLENQVVTPSFRDRRIDADPEFDRGMDDRRLSDRSFLITCEHVAEASNGTGWAMAASDVLR